MLWASSSSRGRTKAKRKKRTSAAVPKKKYHHEQVFLRHDLFVLRVRRSLAGKISLIFPRKCKETVQETPEKALWKNCARHVHHASSGCSLFSCPLRVNGRQSRAD